MQSKDTLIHTGKFQIKSFTTCVMMLKGEDYGERKVMYRRRSEVWIVINKNTGEHGEVSSQGLQNLGKSQQQNSYLCDWTWHGYKNITEHCLSTTWSLYRYCFLNGYNVWRDGGYTDGWIFERVGRWIDELCLGRYVGRWMNEWQNVSQDNHFG